MVKYIVSHTDFLQGDVLISGAKNSALPIIAASLLCPQKNLLKNIPRLTDVKNMCEIISHMGGKYNFENDGELEIFLPEIFSCEISYDFVSKLRASILVMSPILARTGKVRIPLPGGCPIGSRPINLHLKGLCAMGAKITQGHGYVEARCEKLHGANIYLDFPSVGATENLIIASATAQGETLIENCAAEPEICDLANFINAMGGNIQNAGSDKIRICGVENLSPVTYSIIPDRIEAGTFLTAGALCDSDITVKNVIPSHLHPVLAKYSEMGADICEGDNFVRIRGRLKGKGTDIMTMPYPGFPTDMQAIVTALLCTVSGRSLVVETVFENRFLHIPELGRMGADIKVDGRTALINGSKLSGTVVKASDLRAGAALVLAGLCAKGTTEIENAEVIERGYENFDKKLHSLGASIKKL